MWAFLCLSKRHIPFYSVFVGKHTCSAYAATLTTIIITFLSRSQRIIKVVASIEITL